MVFFCIFYLIFERTFCNSGDPDQMPHTVASDLGMHCLPMSHKKDARLIWVKPKQSSNNNHGFKRISIKFMSSFKDTQILCLWLVLQIYRFTFILILLSG